MNDHLKKIMQRVWQTAVDQEKQQAEQLSQVHSLQRQFIDAISASYHKMIDSEDLSLLMAWMVQHECAHWATNRITAASSEAEVAYQIKSQFRQAYIEWAKRHAGRISTMIDMELAVMDIMPPDPLEISNRIANSIPRLDL